MVIDKIRKLNCFGHFGRIVKNYFEFLFCVETKILNALPERAPAVRIAERTILVFSKTNGFRHSSIPIGQLAFRLMGEMTGAFNVVCSEDLSMLNKSNLKRFDAVCFLNTTGEIFYPAGRRPNAVERELAAGCFQDLCSFVKSGRGFIGIHSALDSCYEFEEYGNMINGYFDEHPWTANSEVSIKVESGQERHPLVAALRGENLVIREEIFQVQAPYSAKRAHVLLRVDNEKSNMNVANIKRTDGDFPVSWIRPYGLGRVFYCSLGHNHHVFWNKFVLAHYLAGIQWSIGDLDAPAMIAENGEDS